MIIDKENYYFIAPDNKNGLSVRPPRDLYLADTFEFKINFTIFSKIHFFLLNFNNYFTIFDTYWKIFIMF